MKKSPKINNITKVKKKIKSFHANGVHAKPYSMQSIIKARLPIQAICYVLVPNWLRTGFLLDSYRISIGFVLDPLDSYWIPTRFLSDSTWIPIGLLSDSYWIPEGSSAPPLGFLKCRLGHENPSKSIKIYVNPWKSNEIYEIPTIDLNQWRSVKINENPWKSFPGISLG